MRPRKVIPGRRMSMAGRHLAGIAGTLLALWLFLPATPAYACGPVSYEDGGSGQPGPPHVSDPCAPQAEIGAAAAAAAGLIAAAVATAVSAARGAVPSPGELASALASPAQEAAAPPPALARPAEGNTARTVAGDPVDVVSGQMVTSETDAELPGLLPLLLRRAYASGYDAGRLYGPGWASTLDQRLEVVGYEIHYVGDDAQVLRYPIPAERGVPALPKAGARWPLTWEADGTVRIDDPWIGQSRHFAAWSPERPVCPLTALTDRGGRRISVHHASEDGTRPTEVVHSAGYRIAVDTHNSDLHGARIVSLRLLDGTQDGSGTLLRSFRYGEHGRLTNVVNSLGAQARYEHDHTDRITAWTDANGHRYAYTYDENGRVLRGDGPQGALSAAFAYHPLRRATVVTDSLGHRTEYHYDRHHHITKTVDPLGGSVLTEHDRNGQLLARTDELCHTSRCTLDAQGNVARVDHSDGTSLSARYNAFHQPVETVQPSGATWQHAYDAQGNPLSVTDPTGATTIYTYDERGHLATVTDALGHVHRIETDAAGLVTGSTDALGATTRVTRDAFGRITELQDSLGQLTRLEWTTEGLLTARRHPDGSVERWYYDAVGNETGHEDPQGGLTQTERGPFGNPVARTTADGARYQLAYDSELRLTSVTGPTGLVWRYEHDAAGRLTGEVDFDGRRLSYRLDAAGHLIERINGAGQSVHHTRDTRGRIVESRHGTSTVTTYAYDPNGTLARAHNADATLEFTRDLVSRVLSQNVNGAVTTWEYDARGAHTRRTTPTGAVSEWSYDAVGRPTVLSAPGGRLAFEYDAAGREVTRHLGTTAALTQAYDALDRMTAQSLWSHEATGTRPLRQRTYAYRPDGHLAAIRDTEGGVRHFDLDPLGRVTAIHAAATAGKNRQSREQYAYDALGNLTHGRWPADLQEDDDAQGARAYTGTKIRTAGRVTYTHDTQSRITSRTRTTLSGKTRTWHYSWDAEDRLTQAVTPDGTTWRYHYDPLGRRIAKQRLDAQGAILEQTDFTWDGTTLCEQSTHRPAEGGHGVLTLTWDYAGVRPLSQTERRTLRPPKSVDLGDARRADINARFYAIVTDLVGTPTEMVDEQGDVAWRTVKTLWGATAWNAGATAYTPLRFPGQYFDAETGLHFNYYRYYDPEVARYITPDPLGLAPSPNPNTYVHNPHSGVDPLGLAATHNPVHDTRREAFHEAMDMAGVPRSAQPIRQWTVGGDVKRAGYPNYVYKPFDPTITNEDYNPRGGWGRYYQYATPAGMRVVVEHTADPFAPSENPRHVHAGTPRRHAPYDVNMQGEIYKEVQPKHHIYYKGGGCGGK
ncbi:RHS repeat-associated core domain-containing protein [Streptomyces sp. NPDC056670]|uniref:RHS repeat-associated core domain-containing protein n=1 Tax=Streptomyces sp. NPDC056670 TaxID=3345904 RepID=UPI0036C022D7